MTTLKEMSVFLDKLPEKTIAVLIVQGGRVPTVIRTESLDLPLIWPNWPKACWLGVSDAVSGGTPGMDLDEEPPNEEGAGL